MKLNRTQELEAKRVVVNHILANLTGAPANAKDELMRENLTSLEQILEKLIQKRGEHTDKQAEQQVRQQAQAEIEVMRRDSKLDAAWSQSLRVQLTDGRRLCDNESNRRMLEDLVGTDDPTGAKYKTLILQFPNRFAFETPAPVQTDQERRAAFERTCKENFLSLNTANEQLHKDGVGIEHWSGCSEVERQQFQNEAALRRQKFLINSATDEQLKQEARYEFQTRRDESIRADAARREQYVQQQQRGLYAPLPTVNGQGEEMNSAYFRRLVANDYEKFKALVKRHGSAAITAVMHQQ